MAGGNRKRGEGRGHEPRVQDSTEEGILSKMSIMTAEVVVCGIGLQGFYELQGFWASNGGGN